MAHIDSLHLKFRREITPDGSKYLYAQLFVNGEPLVDYKEYSICAAELKQSIRDGEFFIITCTCGDAGCAGIFEPIQVRRKSREVYWNITQPIKANLRFNVAQMNTKLLKLQEQIAYAQIEEFKFIAGSYS